MVSSFIDPRRITEQQIQNEALLQGQGQTYQYFSVAKFDAAPVAQEVFINAVIDTRLFIPISSVLVGMARFTAWNVTDNTPATCGVYAIQFIAMRAADGTVTFTPTNMAPAAGNPIIVYTADVATLNLFADTPNEGLAVRFTGVAEKTYNVRGTIEYVLNGQAAKPTSNFSTQTS